MSTEFTLALAFTTGLFGSFHCVGMCSGINGGFFIHYGRFPKLSPILAFHGTRIALYSLLGVAGALLGQVLIQAGIVGKAQGILMILAGVLIILLGFNLLGLFNINKQIQIKPQSVQLTGPASTNKLRFTPYLAGLFNGLVPCSLVFSVAVKAAATSDPLYAGQLMLAFGIGTLPSMGTVSLLGSYFGSKLHGGLTKLAGLSVIGLGLWTVYEGVTFYDIMRGLANWY